MNFWMDLDWIEGFGFWQLFYNQKRNGNLAFYNTGTSFFFHFIIPKQNVVEHLFAHLLRQLCSYQGDFKATLRRNRHFVPVLLTLWSDPPTAVTQCIGGWIDCILGMCRERFWECAQPTNLKKQHYYIVQKRTVTSTECFVCCTDVVKLNISRSFIWVWFTTRKISCLLQHPDNENNYWDFVCVCLCVCLMLG